MHHEPGFGPLDREDRPTKTNPSDDTAITDTNDLAYTLHLPKSCACEGAFSIFLHLEAYELREVVEIGYPSPSRCERPKVPWSRWDATLWPCEALGDISLLGGHKSIVHPEGVEDALFDESFVVAIGFLREGDSQKPHSQVRIHVFAADRENKFFVGDS